MNAQPITHSEDVPLDLPLGQTWFAVRTQAKREQAAETAIKELTRLDVFLPVETRLRRTHKGRTRVHSPLMPGYLFVGTNPDAKGDIYSCVSVSAVVDVVRLRSGQAAVINARFINAMRAAMAAGEFDYTPKRKPLQVGGQVKIQAGPFQGLIAKLISAPAEGRARVLIGSGLFQGPTTIDVKNLEPEQ